MSAVISFPVGERIILLSLLKTHAFELDFTYIHTEGFQESYLFKMLSNFCR